MITAPSKAGESVATDAASEPVPLVTVSDVVGRANVNVVKSAPTSVRANRRP